MILLLDNYDSFTYNLYQYLCELGADIHVERNDHVTVDQIEAMRPDKLVVSPGPCTPKEAGVSMEAIERLGPTTPVLGVCLGHQCIGEVYGGTVGGAGEIVHGKTSAIHHTGAGVLSGLPTPFDAIPVPLAGRLPRRTCRTASRSRRGRTRGASWASGTRSTRWRACSSTRSPS